MSFVGLVLIATVLLVLIHCVSNLCLLAGQAIGTLGAVIALHLERPIMTFIFIDSYWTLGPPTILFFLVGSTRIVSGESGMAMSTSMMEVHLALITPDFYGAGP